MRRRKVQKSRRKPDGELSGGVLRRCGAHTAVLGTGSTGQLVLKVTLSEIGCANGWGVTSRNFLRRNASQTSAILLEEALEARQGKKR